MPRFYKISFNATESGEGTSMKSKSLDKVLRKLGDQTMGLSPELSRMSVMNDEHASRFYLQNFLLGMDDTVLGDMTSPQRPELVPNFSMKAAREEKLTASKSVEFQQTEKTIPIFGTRAIVEIDQFEKSLVSIEANLSDQPNVSAVAEITPVEARSRLTKFGEVPTSSAPYQLPPAVVYFADETINQWRLAYHFKSFPMFPPHESHEEHDDHAFCIRNSPRHNSPYYDYFVDAHTGDVFYYFSSAPRLDIPVQCSGTDDEQKPRDFFGLNTGSAFALEDPVRNIKTYDFKLQDIDHPSSSLPTTPVTHTAANFASVNKPAISAHYNATLVFDFFNDELKRNGIDDKGMILESVVNVYSSDRNPDPSPNWGNAVWWNSKMWYGQEGTSTNLVSFARYLDIIGHELTHGVTETTSNLVYRDLSGALNESFSDIFGIMIKNWYPSRPNPISNWNWLMGEGLGRNGGPIRNFKDPAACGQPAHFSQYVPLPQSRDEGGVHIYSGIHNLAAYRFLTSKNSSGNFVFTPKEVAILYYLTLTRLTPISNFSDCRRTLLNVAGIFYNIDPARQAKQDAIKAAYNSVGIV
jgi:bacillolysin